MAAPSVCGEGADTLCEPPTMIERLKGVVPVLLSNASTRPEGFVAKLTFTVLG